MDGQIDRDALKSFGIRKISKEHWKSGKLIKWLYEGYDFGPVCFPKILIKLCMN